MQNSSNRKRIALVLIGVLASSSLMGCSLLRCEPTAQAPAGPGWTSDGSGPQRTMPGLGDKVGEDPPDSGSSSTTTQNAGQRVGNNEVGYITIPANWEPYTDATVPGVAYVDPYGTELIALINMGSMSLDSATSIVRHALEEAGATDINVATCVIDGATANKVSSETNPLTEIGSYVFVGSDNKVRSITYSCFVFNTYDIEEMVMTFSTSNLLG